MVLKGVSPNRACGYDDADNVTQIVNSSTPALHPDFCVRCADHYTERSLTAATGQCGAIVTRHASSREAFPRWVGFAIRIDVDRNPKHKSPLQVPQKS